MSRCRGCYLLLLQQVVALLHEGRKEGKKIEGPKVSACVENMRVRQVGERQER